MACLPVGIVSKEWPYWFGHSRLLTWSSVPLQWTWCLLFKAESMVCPNYKRANILSKGSTRKGKKGNHFSETGDSSAFTLTVVWFHFRTMYCTILLSFSWSGTCYSCQHWLSFWNWTWQEKRLWNEEEKIAKTSQMPKKNYYVKT